MGERKGKPSPLSEALASFLAESGLGNRVQQASIVGDWAALVGPQIASVTEAYAVTADGTLQVGVKTSAWMNELSLMEPQLLRALNSAGAADEPSRPRIRRIRWQLIRDVPP